MDEKTILITGATAGIGLAGAAAMAQQGWRVLVHGRSPEKAAVAVAGLKARVPGGRFEAVSADLADLGDVAALADRVAALAPGLDALWANAGVYLTEGRTTPQGFEEQWAVNHLAPSLLVNRLLPAVRRANGRVVLTSSFAHTWGALPSAFAVPSRYRPMAVYASTKLANVLSVRRWARLEGQAGAAFHAFHPGYVMTNIGANGDPRKSNAQSWLRWSMVTPERGADTGVFLVTQQGLVSGRYWSDRRVSWGSPRNTDANADRLAALTDDALRPYL